MAIAFDAVNTSNHNSTTTFSWTHTPSGTPTLAVVYGYYTNATFGVTSVTYGGVTMTMLFNTVGNSTVGSWQWFAYLPNPPSGAQTVTINKNSDGQNAVATSSTYTGTATDSTAIGNSTSGNDTTTSSTTAVSLTAAAATSWFLITGGDTVGTISSASSTGSGAYSKHASNANVPVFDSNGTVSSGADTITYTWSQSTAAHAWTAIEIKPPGAAASATPSTFPLKSLLGVGI